MNNVAKVIQDKISQEPTGKTMHCTVVEGPLNCLAVNRDSSQVVVAGRTVFKVFSIEDDDFVEKANLRVGRNLNLNFSASDVAWNPIDDHILASAATNGAVVTWNLNRTTRSKQDQVFQEHKRTVNRVTFHANENHLLMSGAQDGFMKLFDLRKKGVSSTFSGKSESVRDIQFSPHHYFVFAAAYENGNVQTWDLRMPGKWERQFPAHGEPVFSLDWHPEDKNWMATAGRDKMIKVWDLTNANKVRNSHSVQAIASVAKIKWRPERRYHIASCSLLVDFSINIWDIRRPYIPFAAFNEHKDVVTGIVWKPRDPHVFFSSSKDCTLYQHMFRDATRPADSANPVGIDINLDGTLAHASTDKLSSSNTKGVANYSQTRLPSFFRRGPDRTEQFTSVTSLLTEYSAECDEVLQMDWLIYSAKNYQLAGKSVGELCDHNARVAKDLGRHQISVTWSMLKLLYDTSAPKPAAVKQSSIKSSQAHAGKSEIYRDADNERLKSTLEGKKLEHKIDGDAKDKHKGGNSTGLSEDESDGQEAEQQDTAGILTTIASGLGNNSHSDFFFGDGDVEQCGFDYDSMGNLQNGQDWNIPSEAFEPRSEIEERTNEAVNLAQNNAVDSPSSATESEFTTSNNHQFTLKDCDIKQEIISTTPFLAQIPQWQFSDIVCDMLHYYAEQGDVQMAVSILIVLGEKTKNNIDETTLEHWFMSYVDLLGRFRLWPIATEIIKLSNIHAVSIMNQQSTRFHTCCGKCGKPLQRVGWLCDRCKGTINTCSICHLPVKGLYAWCQGCSHGGHLEHIKEWLKKYKDCPTGCGHRCEYT